MTRTAAPAPDENLLALVVDGLAAYRLVKLIRQDKIAEPVRDRVLEKHGPPDASMASYLIGCPWCLSVYFGAALAVGRRLLPQTTSVVSRGLALSAIAGLVTEHAD